MRFWAAKCWFDEWNLKLMITKSSTQVEHLPYKQYAYILFVAFIQYFAYVFSSEKLCERQNGWFRIKMRFIFVVNRMPKFINQMRTVSSPNRKWTKTAPVFEHSVTETTIFKCQSTLQYSNVWLIISSGCSFLIYWKQWLIALQSHYWNKAMWKAQL